MKRDAQKTQGLPDRSHDFGRELGAASVMFHAAVAETLGLSITDHKALDILLRAGPMTAGNLAEHTRLTSGAITGVVDRLESAGFVRREKDPDDRRKVIIRPVPAPERQNEVMRAFGSLGRAMAELNSSYSDEELAIIQEYTARAIEVLKEVTAMLSDEVELSSANR